MVVKNYYVKYIVTEVRPENEGGGRSALTKELTTPAMSLQEAHWFKQDMDEGIVFMVAKSSNGYPLEYRSICIIDQDNNEVRLVTSNRDPTKLEEWAPSYLDII